MIEERRNPQNKSLGTDVTTGNDQHRPRWDVWFTGGRLACVIGLFLLLAYPGVVLGSHSFFYRDFGLFGYPLAFYHRIRFWMGGLPLWNPLNNCGLPFLAQWNTLVLYPLSLIYLLFPMPWSLDFFCVIHVVLAGVAMYWLARRWTENRWASSLAGVAYALNGIMLHSLMWPNYLAAFAWMPAVVLLTEQGWRNGGRWISGAALAGAAQMLSGAPEIILFTWLVLAVLAIGEWGQRPFRTVCLRLGVMGVLVAGLTAAQLGPFLDLLWHSQRNVAFGGDVWAMPAWGWANLVVPLFRCTPSIVGVYSQDEQQWSSSYYLGIGVLALALSAVRVRNDRRVRLLIGLALAGLILALGDHGFVYTGVKKVFPLLGFVRYPVKFVILTLFALPLLTAYGLTEILRRSETEGGRSTRGLLAACAVLALATAVILAVAYWFPFPDDDFWVEARSGLSRVAFLAAMAGSIMLTVRWRAHRRAAWAAWGLLVLAGADALTHTPRQNPPVITQAFEPVSLKMKEVPRLGEGRAMVSRRIHEYLSHAATPDPLNYYLGLRRSLYSNCNLLDGVPKVDGFFALYVREEAVVRQLLYGGTNAFLPRLADFLGVKEISSPTVLFSWVNRPAALPLITAGQRAVFASEEATLRALSSAKFSPAETVYLPLAAEGQVRAASGGEARVLSTHFDAERVGCEVEATRPSWVVIAQTYYHPWRAYVSGKRVRLWRANEAFQAVEVPAGRSTVEIVYVDWIFRGGVAVSLVTLAVLFAAGGWRWKKERNSSKG